MFLLNAGFWPTTSITSPRFPASAPPHPIRTAEQKQEAEMTDANIDTYFSKLTKNGDGCTLP